MLLQRMIPLEGFVTNMTMISIITGMKKLLVIFKFQLYGKTFTTQFTLESLNLFVNSFHMSFKTWFKSKLFFTSVTIMDFIFMYMSIMFLQIGLPLEFFITFSQLSKQMDA